MCVCCVCVYMYMYVFVCMLIHMCVRVHEEELIAVSHVNMDTDVSSSEQQKSFIHTSLMWRSVIDYCLIETCL